MAMNTYSEHDVKKIIEKKTFKPCPNDFDHSNI